LFLQHLLPALDLHSFPTRRSSDLNDSRMVKQDGVINEFRKSRRTVNAIQTAFKHQYLLQLRSFHENVNNPNSSTHLKEGDIVIRSEEHTSELQSRFDLVCRLLLEK